MRRGEDATLPVVYAPVRFCTRKLKPGQVKRFMFVGPLFGYMAGCPSCGFIEMHQHEVAQFVETDGAIVGHRPITCMLCHRQLTIALGLFSAVTP